MAKVVQLVLSLSKKLPDSLMFVILTDPLTGELFKIGVAERIMIDFSRDPYEKVKKYGFTYQWEEAYSQHFSIVGDYLYAFYYDPREPFADLYKARINWVMDNNIQIGAYPDSIEHRHVEWVEDNKKIYSLIYPRTCKEGILWVDNEYLFSYGQVIDDKFNIARIYYDEDKQPKTGHDTAFDCVATEQGVHLILAKGKPYKDKGIFLYDKVINSHPFVNGEELQSEVFKKISNEPLYYYEEDKSTGRYVINTPNPLTEFIIKKNITDYVANMKSNGQITLSINDKACYFFKNGSNPSAYDGTIRLITDKETTWLNKPNIKLMYPELALEGMPDHLGWYSHMLTMYVVYYDTVKGFWKDHLYTEEISDA